MVQGATYLVPVKLDVKDMLTKIDTAWYQGQISYDERNELTAIARENATPDMGYANIENRITRVEDRIAALEAKETSGGDTTEYPEWKQPTGAHDAYKAGDKITYDGKRYTCVAQEGVAVTYPPDVFPGFWEENV